MRGVSKIRELAELAETLAGVRRQGRRVVLCHGTFDLLHIGHIRHLKEAAELGDVLVVTLTPDRFVNKGPGRPAFTERLRLEAVAALDMVDYAALTDWPTAVETIGLLRPDVYVKGREYADAAGDVTGAIVPERQAVEAVGGELRFTDDIVFSSSALINRHLDVLPDDVRGFLDAFRGRHALAEVLDWLDRLRTVNVLLLGETIIDEYHSCETMGKSGKEPILAARFLSEERFMGGVLAAVNHVCGLGARAKVVTCLGEAASHEAFIRDTLSPLAEPLFWRIPGAPTIVKRRFVERYPFQKLFEVYVMNGMEEKQARVARERLGEVEAAMAEADLVMVLDYGHGLLCPELVALVADKAPFLAVNTQVNAANHGYNTLSKYPRADYVSLSERELRIDARSRDGDLDGIIADAARRLGAGMLFITKGREGVICHGRDEGTWRVPAFVNHFVDRVGAGDAVFAATALLARLGAPAEIVALVGNAVGAIAVQTVSNSRAVDHGYLAKYLSHLLK